MHRNRTLATALAAATLGAIALTAPAAGASTAAGDSAQAAGCVGSAFSGTLQSGKAICNGNYLVRMQTNGDLVLRVISTGTACWRSATDRAPGGDTSATFHGTIVGPPSVTIDSTSQGRLAEIWGAHTLQHFGTNANVNTRGEFWIGYKKIGACS
ncbi:hypothetical protein [Streptomyces sp. NPDC005485]|uniref:hypothetical protein n=1 Tax=Streptomyces sp. NPDC005485 TaxID=3155591 RepID=UPI0033AD4A6C